MSSKYKTALAPSPELITSLNTYFLKVTSFFSFVVTSLFTNIPLRTVINIILDRIYKDNLITTSLKTYVKEAVVRHLHQNTLFNERPTIYI